MPKALHDRAADGWELLIAIADEAGGNWPRLARNAAVTLSAGIVDEDKGIILLADLRDLLDPRPRRSREVLFSSGILKALPAHKDRPWPEYRRGKPISEVQIVNLLRPLGAPGIW
jgi:Protein of unknown function (DUF3631)